ncbi:NLR family, CARD domain containing 3 [Seminavis robusta]|uniref:NLR family, CARD domain containing 3 n=1 Tax=Seminavis robusta TaxID=568900 RepID=A0A9N8H4P0_9STRA|nr:NLR family, CARD domain containing 3 [Seminavis robusta]|eukprot:Sro89_g047010.1 NLR family, CARD domain containing 3 (460) ;mRNA; r:81876-83255
MVTGTYQLNVSMGQEEAVTRLRTYKLERCVTLVHDRSALNHAPVTDGDLIAIFEALSELQELQKLKVDFVGRPLRLPVSALTVVLQRASKLTQLVLEEVRLAGNVDELEALASALRAHPSLQIVDLHGCVPAEGSEGTLDPLVTALAHVKTLTEVLLRNTRIASRHPVDNNNNLHPHNHLNLIPNNLHQLNINGGNAAAAVAAIQNNNNNNGGGGDDDSSSSDDDSDDEEASTAPWNGSSLCALCQSPSLRVLTLRDMSEIRDQHLELMADSLRSNDSLRELTVCSIHLGERAGRAMGQVLQVNRRLQKLEIQLHSGEHAIPITEVLQVNSSLKRLDLFFNGCISPRIREAFTQMLRCNYRLLDLNGSVWRGQSNSEIDFYLRLNRAGRGDLLTEHATRAHWVDTMIEQRDDLSIVFSLLLMNPSVCLHDTTEFKDVNSPPGGAHGTSLHLRKKRKGQQ